MAKGETIWQKNKKNKNRVKAGEVGYHSSIQRNYGKPKPKNINQLTLLFK